MFILSVELISYAVCQLLSR